MMKIHRAEKVLAGLAGLREEGTLCDVELKAEQQTISAHKAVLSAATPYFAAMFAGKFKETRSRVVAVKDVTFIGLKNVVECIYTTEIDINDDNIDDILPAAHLLQMNDIVEECKEWMLGKLTEANCFSFLRLAEKYSIDTVETAITEFVLKNFITICKTKGFTEISQQALCRYLSSDTLKTDTDEFSVFTAAKTWINKNKVRDSKIIIDIMKHVRFALIPLTPLSKHVCTDDLIDNHKECRRLVGEAVEYHADVYMQPFYKGDLNEPRGKSGLLVISNGQQDGNSFKVVPGEEHIGFLLTPTFDVIRQSDSLNIPIVYESMSAVEINNFLFVFASKLDGYQNFTMRYNASNDTWMDLAAVPRGSVVGSAIASSGDKKEIFLIGGMSVSADSKFNISWDDIIAKVYIYHIQANSWSQCDNLPTGLMYSGAATLRDLIFTTGGFTTSNSTTSNVYAYDIKAKIWLTKANMNHKRCQHTLDAIDDMLYTVGGRVAGAGRNVTSIEVYDISLNQWTLVNPDNADYDFGCSSVVCGNSLYIIGGGDRVKEISIFDIDTNTLTKLNQELPCAAPRSVSAILTLPTLL